MIRHIIMVAFTIILFSARTHAAELSTSEITVQINEKTGAVSSLTCGDIKVLKATQEVWSFENHEGKRFVASSMRNKVRQIKDGRDKITLTVVNPILEKKKVGLSVIYFLEEGLLIKRVELQNNSKEDLVLRTDSKTRVTDKFKKDGLYYVPIGGYCIPANGIKVTLSQLELIPPETLIKTESEEVFKVICNRDDILPATGRYTFTIQAKVKVLNTIVISSSM